MSDGLQIPEVPEPKPEDPEDVSWALSTAEAMWARGDHSEGIKWVRRAAEAASEAENDERALELAKVAAELAGLISRPVSRASIDLEEVVEEAPAAPPPVPSRPSAAPPKAVSKPPAAAAVPAKAIGTASAKQTGPQSQRPPAPLPSQTSPTSSTRGAASAPRPAGAAAAAAVPSSPRPKIPPSTPSKPPPSVRGGAKRSRKSRENLDTEARAAARLGDTAKHSPLDSTTSVMEGAPPPPSSETLLGNNDPTVIGNLSDILKNQESGTPESGDRQTVVGSPQDFSATLLKRPEKTAARGLQLSPSATNGGLGASKPLTTGLDRTSPSGIPAARASVNPPARAPNEQHDPRIVTSQAVRVVVWRDATGIHVAPAGTVVSAITVDAVLVALEPNADLTAWLGARDRT